MIRTVLGDVPPSELGFCHAHEHVLIRGGLGVMKNPDLGIGDVDAAVEELTAFRRAGGGAMVDAMPLDCGRDAAGLVEVSRLTGIHIVAATGFHTPHYYDDIHWTYSYPIDDIVELLVAEVEEGLDEHGYNGPRVRRLAARAGVVKVASELDRIAAVSRKLMEAAAECHRRTGVPVLTHTERGTMALEQVEALTALGVPADAIMVSHVDRNLDHGLHAELARTGAYLVYDGVSRDKYHTVDEVIDLIEIACAGGGRDRVLLGLDLALRSYRRSYGGSPGMTFVLDRFLPALRARGVDATAIHRFGWDNPSRALTVRAAER
ncbi:MAG TPA: hypothetical protein VE575_15235 [Acidimicrobiales bacterium]|nr:hypothetical protein [Acidimicrobiales bacterium]